MSTEQNTQLWNKLGLVYCANDESGWKHSRAFLPTPILLNEDVIRVYVTFLDDNQVGRTGYVDVSAKDPTEIIKVSQNPCLDRGEPGAFDDSGVTASCVISQGDQLLMYYQGWQRLEFAPYHIFSGLAISNDGGETFVRKKYSPVLDRIESQRNIRSAPFVMNDDHKWMIWTCSGSGFKEIRSRPLPVYGISYASSDSLDSFPAEPEWCVYPEEKQSDIFGYARPWVIKRNGKYLVWYSERSASKIYRCKFALSTDGVNWNTCNDDLSIQPSAEGWDSEMVAFSSIIETRYGTYCFYNGNGYGSTGFGVAKLNGTLDDLMKLAG